jgi:hydroxyacylglutathione hydrolase
MGKINYYTSEKISDRITQITSLTGEFMYLVEGTEKALLIDTCVGYGHLRDFVEKLTAKPITVVLTHGHVDHAMGAPEFDDVYMNRKDKEIYQEHKQMEVRKGYIRMGLGELSEELAEEDFVLPTDPNFKELMDGMIFSLGGLDLEIFETPGHTPGSITILLKEERILFLGDSCNTFTFLFDDNALNIQEYSEVLHKLDQATNGRYDRVLLSHGISVAPKDMIPSALSVCQDIILGKADDIPFEFMGKQAYIAKAIGENRMRADGGLGNIVYSKKCL